MCGGAATDLSASVRGMSKLMQICVVEESALSGFPSFRFFSSPSSSPFPTESSVWMAISGCTPATLNVLAASVWHILCVMRTHQHPTP